MDGQFGRQDEEQCAHDELGRGQFDSVFVMLFLLLLFLLDAALLAWRRDQQLSGPRGRESQPQQERNRQD